MFIPLDPAQAPLVASARNLERLQERLREGDYAACKLSISPEFGGSFEALRFVRRDGLDSGLDHEISPEMVSVVTTLQDGTVAVVEEEQTDLLLVQAVANALLKTTAVDWEENFAPPGTLSIGDTIELTLAAKRSATSTMRYEIRPDLFEAGPVVKSKAFVEAERRAGVENVERLRRTLRGNDLGGIRIHFDDADGGAYHAVDFLTVNDDIANVDAGHSPATVSVAVQQADGSAIVTAEERTLDDLVDEAAEAVLTASFQNWKANAGLEGSVTISAEGEIEIDFIDAPSETRHFRYLGADLQEVKPATEDAAPSL